MSVPGPTGAAAAREDVLDMTLDPEHHMVNEDDNRVKLTSGIDMK